MTEYNDSMAKPTRTPMTTGREKVVSVRMSEEEFEEINKKAEEEGLKPSVFLRRLGLLAARGKKE